MVSKVEIRDLLQFHFLASPTVSPDGNLAACLVSQADEEQNRYLSDVWLCDLASGKITRLTSSTREKSFAWTPDSKALVLLSRRDQVEKPGEKPDKGSHFYLLPLAGGEASPLVSFDKPVKEFNVLPDGSLLVNAEVNPDFPNPEKADYLRIEQIPFTSNGAGYICQRRNSLFRLKLDGSSTRLSPELMDVARFSLDKARQKVLAVGPEFKGVRPNVAGLIEIDLTSGVVRALARPDDLSCECAGYLDGGVLVAGSQMKEYGRNENRHFWLIRGDNCVDITPHMDRSLWSSVGSDCRFGIRNWTNNFKITGGKAWFLSTVHDTSKLCAVSADGVVEEFDLSMSVDDFDAENGHFVCVGLKGVQLQELYVLDDGGLRCVSSFNKEYFDSHKILEPHQFSYQHDGHTLYGWYLMPDAQPGEKLPLVFFIHGGPRTTFGPVFFHETQCWAARGFIVVFCNPRGGDGWGNKFADLRGKYGTIDYEDLMAGVDWAEANLPVDSKRMAVTGGSYGGYMTNWIIGHTTRFAAAVSQRSISNWVSFICASDIGYSFGCDEQAVEGVWGSDTEKLWNSSPLKYVPNCRTPTLLIHSDEDFRCELDQGIQMMHALKLCGVESAMCLFRGDSHELSRSGHPRSRMARLREISDWMASHTGTR